MHICFEASNSSFCRPLSFLLMERIAWFLPSFGEKSQLILLWRFSGTFVVSTYFLLSNIKAFLSEWRLRPSSKGFGIFAVFIIWAALDQRAERCEESGKMWFYCFGFVPSFQECLQTVWWIGITSLLCVALMTGRAHKKRMKDGISFFGLGPLKIGLASVLSKTVYVLLFFLHNINRSCLPVVGDTQFYQRQGLIAG